MQKSEDYIMAEMQQQTIQQDDELSLKDFIIKAQEWWRYLSGRWLLIAAFGFAGGGMGIAYAFFQQPKYVAELTFVLEESKGGGGLGSYAGLASQFGIDLGGLSGSSGVFTGENILEFLKSRLMVEKTLLSPVVSNGREVSLAELYIDTYELRKVWAKNKVLQNISFPVHPDRKSFSLEQDSILNTLYQGIVKSNLSISKPDKKLSFILVKTSSKSQIFSKIFTETLVKEATDFYVETKIKRSKANVDLLQAKADSLEILLNKKTVSAATARDLNLNPVRQVATVGTEVVSRDKMMLQTVYAEVIKNLELSKITMSQETPLIQTVDIPILPLKKEKFGKLKGLIIGFFLGSFFVLIWLTARRMYKEIMA